MKKIIVVVNKHLVYPTSNVHAEQQLLFFQHYIILTAATHMHMQQWLCNHPANVSCMTHLPAVDPLLVFSSSWHESEARLGIWRGRWDTCWPGIEGILHTCCKDTGVDMARWECPACLTYRWHILLHCLRHLHQDQCAANKGTYIWQNTNL